VLKINDGMSERTNDDRMNKQNITTCVEETVE